MATLEEMNLFAEKILAPVGERASKLPNSKLTGFLAIKGHRYSHGLMVVGRSVNGWIEGRSPENLGDRGSREGYASKVYDKSVGEDERCPMAWVMDQWGPNVKGYSTKRSAFWRVIGEVVRGLHVAGAEKNDWPSHLVWSNLYKLSPASRGNPGDRVADIQLNGCRDLLELERKTYRPARLLFLTGQDWARPFLDKMVATDEMDGQFEYVQRAGSLSGDCQARFVVARHPQGKPQEALTKEVLQAFHGP